MADKSVIRTIYLYLFALIGLILVVIGSVNFINMGLKAFIFKQAELEQALQMSEFQSMPLPEKRVQVLTEGNELTAEEKAILKEYLKDYKDRKEKYAKINFVTARRQQEASMNLALLLVGIPLYLYHWLIIKREQKRASE